MRGTFYFLGIGGISMSSLARYFHGKGFQVSGYDRTATPLTRQLEEEGIAIHYEEDISLIPKNPDCVVYTPAIPKTNKEWIYIVENNYPLKKRSHVLGELTRNATCIAVAGSHGKTTTSAMIAHILSQSRLGCSAFLGGISNNFNSNLHVDEKSPFVVTEADEYDRSFLQLHPTYSIITAVDPDHLDIYGSPESMIQAFEEFASQTKATGRLFVKEGLRLQIPSTISHETYALSSKTADYSAENVHIKNGCYFFNLRTPKLTISNLCLSYPGLHNIENAIAAAALCLRCGVSADELRAALSSFSGVHRRFEYRIKTEKRVYIDDYAHHPKEIETLIRSVRDLYPEKHLTGIFQPHLYSRTRDLMADFAAVLSLLDTAVLLEIYPAREEPIKGIDSAALLKQISLEKKYLIARESLISFLQIEDPELLLTIGAGNIDQLVSPITQALSHEK